MTGNPFTEIRGSRRRSLRTGFPRNANRRCRFGLTRPKSDETRQATPPPAFLFHSQCQTSRRQMAFWAGHLPHPSWPCRPPRLREARGICPCPLSRQPPFSNFFQRSAEGRKTSKKSRQICLGPISGPAKKTVWSAGGGDIRPPLPPRKSFLAEKAEITRFPQNRIARRVNCGEARQTGKDRPLSSRQTRSEMLFSELLPAGARNTLPQR